MADGAPLMYRCAFLGLKESAASTPDLSSCGWYSKRFMMVRQVVRASLCLAGLVGRATTSRSCSSMELHQFLTLVLLCEHQSLSSGSTHAAATWAKLLPHEQDAATRATGMLCTVQIAQYKLHSTDCTVQIAQQTLTARQREAQVMPLAYKSPTCPIQQPISLAQHSTAQHSTAQHSTAQHGTAQHGTAQHSSAQVWHVTAVDSLVLRPAKTSRSVVLPAPLTPMRQVSMAGLKAPLMPCSSSSWDLPPTCLMLPHSPPMPCEHASKDFSGQSTLRHSGIYKKKTADA